MPITQNSLIENMKHDLKNECIYQIEVLNKTEKDEKELRKLIEKRKRVFSDLLSVMKIKKEFDYNLSTFLCELQEFAHSHNNERSFKILDIYYNN